MVEHYVRNVGVDGSSPFTSTGISAGHDATFGHLLDHWIELLALDCSPSTRRVNQNFARMYIRPASASRP